jgi:hypothetical protein
MPDIHPMRDVILSASDEDARGISTEPICNHARLGRHPSASGSMQVPARIQNSPCQTLTPLVHYLLGTLVVASTASHSAHPALKNSRKKIAQFLCNLSPLNATLVSRLLCVASKELAQTPKFFRCNIYKNTGADPLWFLPSAYASPKSVPEESKCALTP